MTWALIALVLLIAFGPVLWLVPSRKDKRLSALRARARSEGLLVEIRHVPKPDAAPEERVSAAGKVREPVIECAAYSHMLRRKLRHLPAWRLIRKPAQGAPDPFADWQYDQRPKGEGRAYLAPLESLTAGVLERLPAGTIAFELEARRALVYWREGAGSTPDTVSELAATLSDFEVSLAALEAEIESRLEGNDS